MSDADQLVCLSLGLWNGADSILKERLFGLTNAEGNHGEDVKEHYFYLGATPTQVECPTGSGIFLTIAEVANELSHRLSRIFLKDASGNRPVLRRYPELQTNPHYQDYIPFYEFFDGDNGRGAGASHQTGWTGLIAKLLMPRTDG